MKIGIVGGNSNVASEVCFALRSKGHTVYPIVRTPLRGAFLRHHGFKIRVGDISTDHAPSLLKGLDAVVIAAHARPWGNKVTNIYDVREKNKKIVRKSVVDSPENATIIYFSSTVAEGGQYDTGRRSYRTEKKKSENILYKCCDNKEKPGYVLRLPMVVGPNQGIISNIREISMKKDILRVSAVPENDTNIVHTVTIADAVDQCANSKLESGEIYVLVDHPRWSWREFMRYYSSDETDIVYVNSSSESDTDVYIRKSIKQLLDTALDYRQLLKPALLRLPESVLYQLYAFAERKRTKEEVGGLVSGIHTPDISYQFSHQDPLTEKMTDNTIFESNTDRQTLIETQEEILDPVFQVESIS